MKRKCLAVGIILLFIGTAMIPSSGQKIEKLSLPTSRGNTLYVGGSGPGNYSIIQDAVDNASNRDTVFVYHDGSPYYENVIINQSIHLIGEDRNTTVIDGNHSDDVVVINANEVTISGFTLQNSRTYSASGIWVYKHGSNTIMINNNIVNNEYGILIWSGSGYNNISDNNISNNGVGIYFSNTGEPNIENVIQGNIISNNGRGIFLAGVNINGTKIINNKIFNNGFGGIDGVGVGSSGDIICYNEIYSNKEYGIYYSGGANVLIGNNKIHHNLGFGIYLQGQAFIWGVLVNFTINQNDIESNSLDGIKMRWTEASTITQNNIYHNVGTAIFSNSFGTKWDGNYWGTSKRVKMIIGFIRPFDFAWFWPILNIFVAIPMFNFDWHPAQEPYDISGMR